MPPRRGVRILGKGGSAIARAKRGVGLAWVSSAFLSMGVFSEPVKLQAIAQERPGAMETRPEVGGADLEQFASLLGAQAIDFPEEKRIGQAAREPRQAGAENVPEFTRFEDRTRVASPGVRHGTPVSVRLERGVVERSRRGFFRRRSLGEWSSEDGR